MRVTALRADTASGGAAAHRSSTEIVDVMTISCDLPRSGLTDAYYVARTWIGLPISGLFRIHARGDQHLVHPAVGVVFPAGIEYRMTHPVEGGDTDVALSFRGDVIEEALPDRSERVQVTRLDVRVRHAVGVLMAAMRQGDTGRVEDLALAILREIAANIAPSDPRAPSATLRKKIDRVRILLAECPDRAWTVESLARIAGYSPYHFAHQFRAYTGTSVHRYLADMRLAAALRRIESGESSLATVAADLGFAHHSHLTATLRRRLGITPRALREQLRGGTPRSLPGPRCSGDARSPRGPDWSRGRQPAMHSGG